MMPRYTYAYDPMIDRWRVWDAVAIVTIRAYKRERAAFDAARRLNAGLPL